MAGRGKRKYTEADANRSDSNDSTYDNAPVTRSPKKRAARATPKPKSARKPQKRARTYDSDIVEDDDDVDESEEDSDDHSEDEEDEPQINPTTGRRQRGVVAKKQVNYHEDETDDDKDLLQSERASPIKVSKVKKERAVSQIPLAAERPHLVIKLKGVILAGIEQDLNRKAVKFLHSMESSSNQRSRRSRTVSGVEPPASTTVVNTGLGTRRSSRISHTDDPLVELTDSGNHTRLTRRGTATPDPQTQHIRSSRVASKGVKKPPSTVMEASQEEIPASQSQEYAVDTGNRDDILSQLHEYAAGEQAVEVDASEVESPFNPQPEADDDDDAPDDVIVMTQEDDEDVQQGEDADADADADADEDDDDEPIIPRAIRNTRSSRAKPESPPAPPVAELSQSRRSLRPRAKANPEQSSDFEPEAEGEVADENLSSEDELHDTQTTRTRKTKSDDSSSLNGRRSTRLAGKKRGRNSQRESDEGGSELDIDEIADEAAELSDDRRRNKRPRRGKKAAEGITFEPTTLRNRSNRPDYRVFRPELLQQDDEDVDAPAPSQRNRRKGANAPWRSLFSTIGPFGGGGEHPVFGGHEAGAAGGVDSDSSDDDMAPKSARVGGTLGMTPTSGVAPMLPMTHNTDPLQNAGGGPSNLGKVKDRKALADADPLGVDPNVSFDGVGGLDEQIDRLHEMVTLPLMYPEIFKQFKTTPPRGVLFHGPPGTGKTLLARALASSVSSEGKKVTFYMRKGADALSKWVGEAEKQLRLLFEEARKNQPSIIFFDEIDGLAPVRSSKQEQIHASIVATLLALMDGMDGRGQVIVIGATNRPDSVDPALRRPGRFDREFYFPLPNQAARRSILDIHTKGWQPALDPAFKDQLAALTKGYGGADLRALCTEATLNAVQGTFPQIYKSKKKLVIDPTKIKVQAKDFMISIKKMVPSSERSASSGAAPLSKSIEPLLRDALLRVSNTVDEIIPQKKHTTALEEAMYDDRDDEQGFEKETMAREFETSRVFRPRLLIRGLQGMGQQYISAALLSKFEGLHVQSFDLPTLLKDSTRSPEAAIVQLFEEVKRHKPSVIYIPDVETWYSTLSDSAIKTFTGILKSLPPTDPVLLLGVLEQASEDEKPDSNMMRDLFGYSSKNSFRLERPNEPARREYFSSLMTYIAQSPKDFPDPTNRRKRILEELPEAPAIEEPARPPTKTELRNQKKQDRHTLNMLKLHILPIMDQIKLKYKKFRNPVIDDSLIGYIFDEQDPSLLTTDLGQHHEEAPERPFKLDKDEKGVTGLRDTVSGKFYYNLEIVTIEKRLSNGYYKRPKDFLADIKRLAKDARNSNDMDRTLKGNEMVANVEVDMITLETNQPALIAECEAVALREEARERGRLEKEEQARLEGHPVPTIMPNVPPHISNSTTDQSTGPVRLGEDVPIPGQRTLPPFTPARLHGPSPLSNGTSNDGRPSNGSTVPSRDHDDTEMTDSQDQSIMTNPSEAYHHNFATPGAPNTQRIHTQTSAITRIHPGTDIKDYYNSASTTTSGQKTSDQSNQSHRSSAPFSAPLNGSHDSNGSNESNGVRNGDVPDFNFVATGGSQIPDTQPEYGSSQSHASQSSPNRMGPPPQHSNRHPSSLHALLNDPVEEPQRLLPPEPLPDYPPVVPADPNTLIALHSELVAKSSGLSVEQLEQVMASLMDAIWKTKGNANRNHAAQAILEAFNGTIKDIENYQQILDPSQKERFIRE